MDASNILFWLGALLVVISWFWTKWHPLAYAATVALALFGFSMWVIGTSNDHIAACLVWGLALVNGYASYLAGKEEREGCACQEVESGQGDGVVPEEDRERP